MPFSTTASIISTDLDNMYRGLYRDNSDTALTSTLTETTLKSFNVPANTIGATGTLHVVIAGTVAGAAGTKTMRLKFGGTLIATITQGAGVATPWHFDVWIHNTATNAQRFVTRQSADASNNIVVGYSSVAIDTSQNQTLSVTGQLANIGDTTTAVEFDVFVIQIN